MHSTLPIIHLETVMIILTRKDLKKLVLLLCILLLQACSHTKKSVDTKELYTHSTLQEIPFHHVSIQDNFWLPKIKTIQEVTIPSLLDLADDQGKIDNFKIVAGIQKGKISLYNAPDSDVYKLIEAAGYSFANLENKALESRIDKLIDVILKAQNPNGYLHTQYMLDSTDTSYPNTSIESNRKKIKTFGYGPQNKWKSFKDNWPYAYSQLYCAGHFMEAAVAYYRGTGKDSFLKGAIKFADLICKEFDEEKIKTYADHPQVEIGLMKIYEVTADEKYLKMADLFSRYINFARPPDISKENEKPLVEQTNAFGHAVRTAYLYSGATDVARASGASDIKNALDSLWFSVATKKMYVHGGTGNGTRAEQHGLDYDLPIEATYSESCANIAQGQWNHRLNLLTGNSKYADVVELEAYNSALSSISQDGKSFFYSNKLNIGEENRKNEHSGVRKHYLFCCPSKAPGFISGIGRWAYAKDKMGIYINQYLGSKLHTDLNNKEVQLKVETKYPYGGKIRITVLETKLSTAYAINFRVPAWLKETPITGSQYFFDSHIKPSYSVQINNRKIEPSIVGSDYITLNRKWIKGDIVEINFEMPVRKVFTKSNKIKQNSGRLCLMRGPLIYTLEDIDNEFDISNFVLDTGSDITTYFNSDLYSGVPVLEGKGTVNNTTVKFKAIPYFLWQNRGIGAMSTLIIYDPTRVYTESNTKQTEMNTNG